METKKDKIKYIVIFISEFSKKHNITSGQAYRYLKKFGGVEMLDEFYDVMHTQSLENMVTDITTFCHKKRRVATMKFYHDMVYDVENIELYK